MRAARWIATLSMLVVVGAACGTGPQVGAPPEDSPTPTPPAGTTTVTVYWMIQSEGRAWITPERREVAQQEAIGRATLEELVSGTPSDPDHLRPLPDGTRVLDFAIADGTATVDWSAEVLMGNAGAAGESLAIQAVVYTLTEFPTVDRVIFMVEGKTEGTASNGRVIEDWWGHVGLSEQPFVRADGLGLLAPITVMRPSQGDRVGTTIAVEGEATTFEANVAYRLFDASGTQVQMGSTTATEGGPGRGTYQMEIEVESPPESPETWRLEIFESSAEDGSDFFVESRDIIVG